MRVVNTKPIKETTIHDIEVGEAFMMDGLLYIKTDETLSYPTMKSICMDRDGVLFRFDTNNSVQPINVTLVVGDYNEED